LLAATSMPIPCWPGSSQPRRVDPAATSPPHEPRARYYTATVYLPVRQPGPSYLILVPHAAAGRAPRAPAGPIRPIRPLNAATRRGQATAKRFGHVCSAASDLRHGAAWQPQYATAPIVLVSKPATPPGRRP